MDKSGISGIRLGILGGGQLGRMLIQKSIDYNVKTIVLDSDIDCPCSTICDEFIAGNINDYDTVLKFGSSADVLTIEIEHVNVDALEMLQKLGKKVYPQPEVIRLVQDKGLQKMFYEKNKIPTSPFFLTESRNGLMARAPKFPFVQKLRKSGYDGRGVVKISSEHDMSKSFDAPSVVEEMIDVKKEISVLVARNTLGETSVFPVVELVFNQDVNLVESLFAPADISPSLEKEACDLASRIIISLDMVGLLAVEFFITHTGILLVNEIAPRPHNSGHHTIEANLTSQYEQHVRAILGLPLGSTKKIYDAVMLNLLGEPGFEGEAVYENIETILAIESVYLHLYGKKFTRPFRKMGHITILGETLDAALTKAKEVSTYFKVTGKKIIS